MIGQRLGHFEILEKLGAGGMGDVYRARDSRLDRIVAIKVLPPAIAGNDEARQRLRREARAIASLSHPHICTLFEIGQERGTDFLVMEYLEGEPLSERLKQGRLPLSLGLRYAVQIAQAVAAAHAAGVVHRDLKPGNVMLTKTGTKLLDFGLAKLRATAPLDDAQPTRSAGPATAEGAITGTVGYMSPEQAEGRPVDTRSDVFSFGALLYEMFGGRKAFRGDTGLAVLAAILHKDPPPLAGDLPDDLGRVIFRCLRKNPDERYQHISDVGFALEELEESTGALRSARAGPGRRGLSVRVAGAAAALAVPAVVLAWWVTRGADSPPPVEPVPLTSEDGLEESPGFSPDGSHVAFSWNGQHQDNFDIYVKAVGAPMPQRLTTDPADDRNPVFSPDGRTIGFVRVSPHRRTFVVIPAIGGSERTVAEIPDPSIRPGAPPAGALSAYGWGWSFAWLPDGRFVVLDGLQLLSLETGEVRDLVGRAGGRLDGWFPAVAPNGRTLAFVTTSGHTQSGLYLLDLSPDGTPSGEPRRVTLVNGEIAGLAWMDDGRHIVLASGRPTGASGLDKTLSRVEAVSGARPEPLPFGEHVTSPAIAPNGSRLAFVRNSSDGNIWRATLPGHGDRPPPAPVRFISSTRNDGNAQYSPDGRRIAFASGRGGAYGIWVSDADASNPMEVFSRAGTHAGTPRWSPDSQRLAFDSSAEGSFDVYVTRPGSGQVIRLTTDAADDAMPSWSPDGAWIYFASNRTGRREVWRVSPGGGPATQVTRNGGGCAFPSADGSQLYYTKHDADSPLWRMPVAGGEETEVLPSVLTRNFVVFDDGIYFIPAAGADGSLAVHHLVFSTGAITPVAALAGPVGYGITVSPDRRHVLYTKVDQAGRDLMLVDPFPPSRLRRFGEAGSGTPLRGFAAARNARPGTAPGPRPCGDGQPCGGGRLRSPDRARSLWAPARLSAGWVVDPVPGPARRRVRSTRLPARPERPPDDDGIAARSGHRSRAVRRHTVRVRAAAPARQARRGSPLRWASPDTVIRPSRAP